MNLKADETKLQGLESTMPGFKIALFCLRVQSTQVWSIYGFCIRNRKYGLGYILSILVLGPSGFGWVTSHLLKKARGVSSKFQDGHMAGSGLVEGLLGMWLYIYIICIYTYTYICLFICASAISEYLYIYIFFFICLNEQTHVYTEANTFCLSEATPAGEPRVFKACSISSRPACFRQDGPMVHP